MRDVYESPIGQLLATVMQQFLLWERPKWDKIITGLHSLLPLWFCFFVFVFVFFCRSGCAIYSSCRYIYSSYVG